MMIGGISAGILANNLVKHTRKLIAGKCITEIQQINTKLSPLETAILNDVAKKTLLTSKLHDKKIEIIDTNKINLATIKKVLNSSYEKIFLYQLFPNLKNKAINSKLKEYYNGRNASFFGGIQKIIVSQKKHPLAIFHELGHAINYNFQPFWQNLQKQRKLKRLVAPILIISLLKNKKQNNEKTTGILDKATTFIKNNAGKLAFISFIPILAEEAKASLNAKEIIKGNLPVNLAKKVTKSNMYAYATYLTTAFLTSFGIYMANKVRDKIVEK